MLRGLEGLAFSLMAIANEHHKMSIVQVAVFCFIAANENCSSSEVEKALGIASGTMARALGILAHQGYQGTPPLELIVKTREGRTNILTLSAKGKRLAALLAKGATDGDPRTER